MALPSIALNEGQSLIVTVTPLDFFGAVTTNLSDFSTGPVITVDNSSALAFTATNGSAPWTYHMVLASPPIAGTFTITASVTLISGPGTVIHATGTVTVNTNGPATQIAISFGTPTTP